MNQKLARAMALLTIVTLAACGGGEQSAPGGSQRMTLENRTGQPLEHLVGEPATISLPVGERLTIRTSEPVRWRIEYQGAVSYGSSRNVQLATVTLSELHPTNPSTAWSAEVSGTVAQGERVRFTLVAETNPETVFDVAVRQ